MRLSYLVALLRFGLCAMLLHYARYVLLPACILPTSLQPVLLFNSLIYLFTSLFIYLFTYLFIYLLTYLLAYLLFICMYLFISYSFIY
jgi:hypothetical protein